jgi:hypothetical protein
MIWLSLWLVVCNVLAFGLMLVTAILLLSVLSDRNQ